MTLIFFPSERILIFVAINVMHLTYFIWIVSDREILQIRDTQIEYNSK